MMVCGLGEVKVDSGTDHFLPEVKETANTCNVAPQALLFGLYNIPSVVLVLHTVPVLTPWLNAGNRQSLS